MDHSRCAAEPLRIGMAVLPPDRDVAEVDKIFNGEESVRRLVTRLGRPSGLWTCYEAGPTDYDLHRLLAGLHRAGELTALAVPTPAQEAVRDLCGTRGDMVQDLTRARNRLSGFLLRHSMVWRGGSTWTERHYRWLATSTSKTGRLLSLTTSRRTAGWS